MARLTLLLPASARFAGITLPPQLAKALGRADRTQAEPGEPALLARHFDVLPRGWPAAALTRLLDAGEDDARGPAWLRADPAHIRPDINGARLLGIGRNLGVEQADAEALLPALRPLFGDAGFLLDAPHPQRWYLRLPRATKLPLFAAPEEALGDDVFEHRAEGPEARRWRLLESEVQITLHNHPHNTRRLEQGRVPINALWLWGGGVLPDAVTSHAPTVYSDDPAVQGAAQLGKLHGMPIVDISTIPQDALVDLRSQRDMRVLVERWFLPALSTAAEVTFNFADGRRFCMRAAQRWRVWRKSLPALSA